MRLSTCQEARFYASWSVVYIVQPMVSCCLQKQPWQKWHSENPLFHVGAAVYTGYQRSFRVVSTKFDPRGSQKNMKVAGNAL